MTISSEETTSLIGQDIDRKEDPEFITGSGKYTDDYPESNAAHLAIVRSQYAHAEITDIDTSAAEQSTDVISVFTATDVEHSSCPGEVPLVTSLYNPDDAPVPINITTDLPDFRQPFLSGNKTRYVGEPLAVVIANSRYAAHDAANRVTIEYDRLPAVTDPPQSLKPDAPTIHADRENNIAFEWEIGSQNSIDEIFAEADHAVSVHFDRQRVISNPMEPRGCLARYASSSDELTIRIPGQGPHSQQSYLAEAFGKPPEQIHVQAPAVGGSFGTKSRPHPGELLTAWSAIELDRPIKWQATRSESHLASAHGRGHTASADMAFDTNGNILGLRVNSEADVGAYVFGSSPVIHTKSLTSVLSGQYTIPEIHCHVTGTFTNTTPITAFRATSRPMGILLVERLLDKAAHHLGIDKTQLRKQNFIQPTEFPYKTALGYEYDSGDYEKTLNKATSSVSYDEWKNKNATPSSDELIGVGFACSVDQISSSTDSARIRIHQSGKVTAYCGTFDTGQGHRTTYAQLLTDELGVPFEDINIVEGDSEDLAVGGGTGGSRSAISASQSIRTASNKIREKAKKIAAYHLEVTPEDLEFSNGTFSVSGVPTRTIDLAEVAELAYSPTDLPESLEPGLEEIAINQAASSYSFATHAAVVSVDPETGDIRILDYAAVEDCGPRINPKIVEGQVHGAVAQGIGQALYEEVEYDDTGTLLTASFQDYAIPKSFHVPPITVETTETPAPDTVRGIKGIGESGTNASPAAITNAVYDALEMDTSGEPLSPPFTPEKVWRYLDS